MGQPVNDIHHIAFVTAANSCNQRFAEPDPRTLITANETLDRFTFFVRIKGEPSPYVLIDANAPNTGKPAERIPFRVRVLVGEPTPKSVESFYIGHPGMKIKTQKPAWLIEPVTGPTTVVAKATPYAHHVARSNIHRDIPPANAQPN